MAQSHQTLFPPQIGRVSECVNGMALMCEQKQSLLTTTWFQVVSIL